MLRRAMEATNASKFVILLAVNWLDDFGEAFGLFALTDAQEKAINGGLSGALFAYFLATYTRSRKRIDADEIPV